jgi:hypothetical protein
MAFGFGEELKGFDDEQNRQAVEIYHKNSIPNKQEIIEDFYSTLVSVEQNLAFPHIYNIVEQDKTKGTRTTTLDLADKKIVAETKIRN